MAVQHDSTSRTFSFASAISAFRLVKVTGENAAAAATNGAAIGFVEQDAAANETATVKLFHPTYFATVSGAGVAAGSVLHAIADGKVASAGGVTGVGIALNAGTTNDIIEIAIPRSSIS
jgi:hypothetical protein